MTNINENLQKMLSARYGRDMRQAIHDSIESMSNKIDNTLSDDNMNTVIDEQVREYLSKNQVVSDDQIEEAVNGYFERNDIDGRINELLDENGITDLTEAIGYTEIKHVNLFNKNDIIEGNTLRTDIGITRYDSLEISNTVYLASTSMFITHKIAVKEGDTVRNNIGWARCFFFNADGERLISIYATGNTDTKEIVAPPDASYVRFSFMNTKLDIAMITINEEMPAIYEPFYEKQIERIYNSLPETINRITSYEKQIEITYNSLSETIARVTSLEKPLNGVNWVAFGDSLTSSITLSSQEETKNYVDFVTEKLGLNVKNMGVGGTGYKKTDNNFCNRISDIPTDTDILTVFGSFNDYDLISTTFGNFGDTTTDTICGSMYYFFDEVYKRCPNVVIGCILPTKWGYLSDWKNKENAEKCDMYIDALIKTCNKFGIPYLDLYNNSGLRPWDDNFKAQYYRDDNNDGVAETVHPLSNAHKKFIAPKVEAFIKQIYGV